MFALHQNTDDLECSARLIHQMQCTIMQLICKYIVDFSGTSIHDCNPTNRMKSTENVQYTKNTTPCESHVRTQPTLHDEIIVSRVYTFPTRQRAVHARTLMFWFWHQSNRRSSSAYLCDDDVTQVVRCERFRTHTHLSFIRLDLHIGISTHYNTHRWFECSHIWHMACEIVPTCALITFTLWNITFAIIIFTMCAVVLNSRPSSAFEWCRTATVRVYW